MSKISDELRAAANLTLKYGSDDYNRIHNLAGRIDAEMVELPNDADGVPIHIDDTVWNIWGGGEAMTVKSITLHPCGVAGIGFYVLGSDININPTDLTHTRPDSFELIADELDEWKRKAAEKIPGFGLEEDALHALADRIRKLAKERDDE